MKLATYTRASLTSVGRVEADRLVELASVLPSGVCTMLDLLRAGPGVLAHLEKVATGSLPTVPLASVHLMAPVLHPSKFLAIGLNYRDHLREVLARGGKAP